MYTIFVIGGLIILWFVSTKNINPSEPLKVVSIVLLTFPLILLGIFAIPSIKKSIKKYYKEGRDEINQKIKNIREEQGKINDIEELINLDKEVVFLREGLRGMQSNRFEKSSIFSAIWFIVTLFILYLDLGIYLNIATKTLGTITFLVGVYYLADMIKVLLYSFEK